MDYKLSDYRRCGNLYYPVRFLAGGSIVVIDDPKDEKEMLEIQIEYDRQQILAWEREGLLPKI